MFIFFFKQKTAYEMRISDWSSDVCSSDLPDIAKITFTGSQSVGEIVYQEGARRIVPVSLELGGKSPMLVFPDADVERSVEGAIAGMRFTRQGQSCTAASRSEEHTSELQSLMRISYAGFCLKKKNKTTKHIP